MKKTFFVVLALLSLLVSVAAVPMIGRSVVLVAVRNDTAGPTFIFRVPESLPQSELDGIVNVSGGDSYNLYCGAPQEEGIVICHTSRFASGHNVSVTFGGSIFWAFVPDQALYPIIAPIVDWKVAFYSEFLANGINGSWADPEEDNFYTPTIK